MASYTFENHTFRMVDRTDGKDIKVPSNMYPLNREAQLFTTETTDTISDAHVREIVNCIDGRMNNTYQNAEQVVRTLNVYGIPAVQYVGWVFMSDSAPMCTTDQGLKLYQKVMRAFPKHPANLEAEHAQRAMVERVMKGKI